MNALLCFLVSTGLPALQADQQQAEAAAMKGLRFLARTQQQDGGWPVSGFTPQDRLADVALCALAFQAQGSTVKGGEFREPLRRAVRFLQRHVPARGPLMVEKAAGPVASWQRFESWYAALAALALSEVHLCQPSALNEGVLRSLAERLRFLRKPGGAWCHDLEPKVRQIKGLGKATYSDDMVAVTNLCVLGLLRIRAAGIELPTGTLDDRLIAYYDETQNEDGGFQYGRNHVWLPAKKSEPGRTTGALLVCVDLFGPFDNRCHLAARYLEQNFAEIPFSSGHGGNPFLISYVTGAWACAKWSTSFRSRFLERFGSDLRRRQREDGSFQLTGNAWTTKANNTAGAVLCLLAGQGKLSFTRPQPWSATIDRQVGALRGARKKPAQEKIRKERIQGAWKWLSQQRHRDGYWDGRWGDRHVDLALTGAVALGMLANGDRQRRGIVQEAVRHLAAEVDKLAIGGWKPGGRSHLGFQLPIALVALCAYGQRDPDIVQAVRHAIDRLVATQWSDGGWSYDNDPAGRKLYTLLSTTTGAVAALAVARRTGYAVPKDTITKGLEYLRACATDDGGLGYCPDPKHPILARDRRRYARSEPGRTFAALGAMCLVGTGRDVMVRKAIANLRPQLRTWAQDEVGQHLWFNILWASFAEPLLPDSVRSEWQDTLATVLARQGKDGSFAWSGLAWSAMLSSDPMQDRFATGVALYLLAQSRL